MTKECTRIHTVAAPAERDQATVEIGGISIKVAVCFRQVGLNYSVDWQDSEIIQLVAIMAIVLRRQKIELTYRRILWGWQSGHVPHNN